MENKTHSTQTLCTFLTPFFHTTNSTTTTDHTFVSVTQQQLLLLQRWQTQSHGQQWQGSYEHWCAQSASEIDGVS